MSLRARSLLKIAVILLIGFFLAYMLYFGIKIGPYQVAPAKKAIKLGLDLQGGIYVLLEAKPKPGETITDEKMNAAKEVIARRVDQLGVAEPVVVRQGENRIRVELPGVKDSQKALEVIGKTASLQFIGPDQKVILTGDNVSDAKAVYDNLNRPLVSLKLDSEGAKKFEEATKKFLNKPIAIVLDGEIISAPVVMAVITNGEAVIEGISSIDEAAQLAALIRGGALPIDLEQREIRSVGPTLGADSLAKSLRAGIVGVFLVMAFMILYYRIPGLIADIALMFYIMLTLIVFIMLDATLTLPGIAGFILSVGMAVDANVLIFERFKEELRSGKTLRAAMDSGFYRALTTIIDSNLTTIIAALVLFYFGTGPIKGFAVTLIIGNIASLFTAIVVTRILLVNLINTRLITNKKLFSA
ncbi:protein translocase subunit SecD [Thermosediminibacter oceani]|uniref:Protein translocase subunit SecD n=1 Tax=Thermosediminibacter oceani (strain ATCC BAA-1034 / DSM 16646 / JW/IW-1228P) TaxID=555079 RepID=D9RXQ2_THEOJ|nr:protein translocase subunit SecD [Thermosediminibacter oceani]ADL08126.1 protein-export membrane protein SecD [Thermosediminibacter oceani DSM 16646]